MRGFTLMEVIVSLGIAGGALVLLMSANRESLQRSVKGRTTAQLKLLAQSKLDELKLGLEQRRTGNFPIIAGYTWDSTEDESAIEELKYLKRISVRLLNSDGSIVQSLEALVYRHEVSKL